MSLEENRALVRREVEFWNTGDMAIFDEIMAPSFIGHDPGGLHSGTLEEYRAKVEALLAAFEDIDLVIDDLIAEGDKAVKRWTVTLDRYSTLSCRRGGRRAPRFAAGRRAASSGGSVWVCTSSWSTLSRWSIRLTPTIL